MALLDASETKLAQDITCDDYIPHTAKTTHRLDIKITFGHNNYIWPSTKQMKQVTNREHKRRQQAFDYMKDTLEMGSRRKQHLFVQCHLLRLEAVYAHWEFRLCFSPSRVVKCDRKSLHLTGRKSPFELALYQAEEEIREYVFITRHFTIACKGYTMKLRI